MNWETSPIEARSRTGGTRRWRYWISGHERLTSEPHPESHSSCPASVKVTLQFWNYIRIPKLAIVALGVHYELLNGN